MSERTRSSAHRFRNPLSDLFVRVNGLRPGGPLLQELLECLWDTLGRKLAGAGCGFHVAPRKPAHAVERRFELHQPREAQPGVRAEVGTQKVVVACMAVVDR